MNGQSTNDNDASLMNKLKHALKSNLFQRAASTAVIVVILTSVFMSGPIYIIGLVFVITLAAFKEILQIQKSSYRFNDAYFVTLISWLLFMTIFYNKFGTFIIHHTRTTLIKNDSLQAMLHYHKFICVMLYFLVLVFFVLNLKTGQFKHQFRVFGMSLLFIMFIASEFYFLVSTLMKGYIWLLMTFTLIALNDIFAYAFGRWLGKTSLIAVSPKKTVEGFAMAFICTMIAAVFIPLLFINHPTIYCPLKLDYSSQNFVPNIYVNTGCKKSKLFLPKNYQIFKFKVTMLPIQIHSIVIGLFSSLIAPFGGFFASGYKRSMKIKDFGTTIPGHGGILDRIDCHMAAVIFVNVYTNSLFNSVKLDYVLYLVNQMTKQDLMQLRKHLDALIKRQ